MSPAVAGVLAALAASIVAAPGALATTPEERVRAAELAIEGRAAMADRRYVDAATAFEAAWALDPAPALVLLRARAEAGEAGRLREADKLEQARVWFGRAAESFAALQRMPGARAELAAEVAVAAERDRGVRAEIRAIDAELARRRAEAEADRRAEEAAREAAERERKRLTSLATPEPEEAPGPGLPWPEIVTVGAGTVAVGVGTWLLIDAEATRADVRDAETEGDVGTAYTQSQVDALEREANTRATWGVVAVTLGGAAIGTGVTLLLLDAPEGEARTTIGGAPLPGGGLITATGSF